MKRYLLLIVIVAVALILVVLTPWSENETDLSNSSNRTLIKDSTYVLSEYELPQSRVSRSEFLVAYSAYTASYNPIWRIPNWVAWRLTASRIEGEATPTNKYLPDPQMNSTLFAQMEDYLRSGYDAARMCPASDNKWCANAMKEASYWTNVVPQSRPLDKGDWKDLENKCRKWAQKYGEILIVCGPIVTTNKPITVIGKNKVCVPDTYFKVVLRNNESETKAIGFVFENRRQSRTVKSYAVTIKEIERLTGLDFFCHLPDEKREKVKTNYNWEEWR